MHALPLAFLIAAAQTPGTAPAPAAAPPPPVTHQAVPAPPPPASAGPARANGKSSPAPSREVIEKMGQGDRAFLERDYRNALFAYLDAVYMAPAAAAPRVKLGRAYLAMRYPARAAEQAEKALALDPSNGDARKLLEEARAGSAPGAAPRQPAPASGPPAAAPPAGAQPPSSRVFRYTPESSGPAPAGSGTGGARAHVIRVNKDATDAFSV